MVRKKGYRKKFPTLLRLGWWTQSTQQSRKSLHLHMVCIYFATRMQTAVTKILALYMVCIWNAHADWFLQPNANEVELGKQYRQASKWKRYTVKKNGIFTFVFNPLHLPHVEPCANGPFQKKFYRGIDKLLPPTTWKIQVLGKPPPGKLDFNLLSSKTTKNKQKYRALA